MDPITVALFVLGFGLLVYGADLLVRGSAHLAVTLGISPLVVGLTVVAFGTSSPELAVSVHASFIGESELALGNVVGSNILNILLILGLSAAITPLLVSQQLVRLEVPLMIGASVLVFFLARDRLIDRAEAALLFACIVVYLAYLFAKGRTGQLVVPEDYERAYGGEGKGGMGRQLLQVALGVGLLVLGARWLVIGAVAAARYLGVSELIIGLTIVAVGTSLPELAASVVASARGERDIAVGNVVGSNLFNLLLVLGLTGIVAPAGIDVPSGALAFDLPVMIGVAVACLPIFFSGYRINRWEGALFVGYYVAYTVYLVLHAIDHDLLEIYSTAMLWFVIPMTGITLLVLAGRAYRRSG